MYIIPRPQKMQVFEKKIKAETFRVITDNAEIIRFTTDISKKDGICKIIFKDEKDFGKEQYKIIISEEGIKISYGTEEAAFRAYATLKQIIAQKENGEISCMEIEDFPSIENRGYMLDISRGKLPKPEYIKKLIDMLADLKYNQLQLYMESFVYEYKNFPQYSENRDVLSREDIEELEVYCKERYIQLVPNQNGFGHMWYWLTQKENSHLAITEENGNPSATLNPLLPETIEFMDKIYDGLLDVFSAEMVNIGMDEPFELGTAETKEACEKYGIGKVYTDYLNKICALAYDKYGKTPMFWDDIVFKHPEQLDNIPKNAIVMEWGYEGEQHFDRNCRRLQERGLRFYVCPGTSMWASYIGRSNNAVFNIMDAAECGNYYGAEGFLLTEWGDDGHPQFPAVTWFPLVFAASAAWNCGSHNHEVAYEERRNLIDECKKYIDTYFYKVKNNISAADIVFRAGNYYLLEDLLKFNRTELNYYIRMGESVSERKKERFKAVKRYISDLKDELAQVEMCEKAKAEINLNCDMVMLFADILSGKKDNDDEISRILTEFKRLWEKDNYMSGIEIFTDILNEFVVKR